jgi:DNA-binding SARP family transcriptional activator
MSLLRVQLLGGLQICYSGNPVRTLTRQRVQELFAYLLLHRHQPVLRQEIAFLFWPDRNEVRAFSNFRSVLARLNQALPALAELTWSDDEAIYWREDAQLWLDVAEFERALTAAQQAEVQADRAGQIAALRQAVDLYTGDFLPRFFDDWVLEARQRLRNSFLSALSTLILLLREEGVYADAIHYAHRLLTHDPLSEAAYRTVIDLYDRNGDRVSALRLYDQCVAILRRELAVEPGPALQALYTRLMNETSGTQGRGALAEATLLHRLAQRGRAALEHGQANGGIVGLVTKIARMLARRGELEEALALVEGALARLSTAEARGSTAELHWLRSRLLLQQEAAPAEVEAALLRAIELARRSGALALLLQATVDRCLLWIGAGRAAEAPRLLAELDGWLPLALRVEELETMRRLLDEEW